MSDFDKQQLGVRPNSDSVTAGNNNSGLTVTLDGNGRNIVNMYWNLGGDATITFEGRNPNGLNEWVELATYDTTNANIDQEDMVREPYNSFEEYRMTTSKTGIDIDFEIGATR
jgi:hypothetical protein